MLGIIRESSSGIADEPEESAYGGRHQAETAPGVVESSVITPSSVRVVAHFPQRSCSVRVIFFDSVRRF